MSTATLRAPAAWKIHETDVVRFGEQGQHCDHPRCREAVTVVTWRRWQSAEAGRELLAEHFVCTEHGQDFARRHHLEVEAAPDRPSRRA